MNEAYIPPEIVDVVDIAMDVGSWIGLFIILSWCLVGIFWGLICTRMARKKGYRGYFWMGFFLRLLAFIYVICLPDMILRKYIKMCSMKVRMSEEKNEWSAKEYIEE